MSIERGGVYWHYFGPRSDSRQEGRRPVIVVQTDLLNRLDGYSLTIVVPCTTSEKRSQSRVQVEPSPENGLQHTSYAMCEQIHTIPKALLRERIGHLSKSDLFRLNRPLSVILDLT